MIRALLAVTAALTLLTGCHASCKDACDNISKCIAKIAPGEKVDSDCASSCEKDNGCGANRQAALDCVASIKCADRKSAESELAACGAKCGN